MEPIILHGLKYFIKIFHGHLSEPEKPSFIGSGVLVDRSLECFAFWAIAYERRTQYLRFIDLSDSPQTSSLDNKKGWRLTIISLKQSIIMLIC